MFNKDLIKEGDTIVVGLSGGPDSVCLLHFLHSLKKEKKFTLIAAHLDHEWRTDSHKDAEFCSEFCATLNVPLVVKKISELSYEVKKTGSKEDKARQYRRHFLQDVASKHQADYIALGHHEDDQIETFFIRLMRGTTLTGLRCMRPQSGNIIRPLLHLSKENIFDYAYGCDLTFLTDPTNSSSEHLRNRVRTMLMPILNHVDERSTYNILRAMASIKESEELLDYLVEKTYTDVIHNERLDVKLFRTFPLSLQKRIVRQWITQSAHKFTLTESFINEIVRFLDSERGGTHTLGNWSIVKKAHKASFTSNADL